MSLKAMLWVLEEAPVDAPYLPILFALADRAGDDGTAAWPSREWLAERARCSVRTVQRHLGALEEAGVIRRGDQELVSHIRADRRPIVWDIIMDGPVDNSLHGVTSSAERGDRLSPRSLHGVTSSAERGDTGVTQTVLEPSFTPLTPHRGETDETLHNPTPDDFAEFAAAYPIKDKISRARHAWDTAATDTPPSVLVQQALSQTGAIRQSGKPAYLWLRDKNYLFPLPKTPAEVQAEHTARYLESQRARGTPPPPDLLAIMKQLGIAHLAPSRHRKEVPENV